MIYQRMGRRFFLRGLGGSLLLPYLPSVMSKAYGATGRPPKRYVQVLSSMGYWGQRFHPADVGFELQGSTGVHAKPLSSVSGSLSAILGADFDALKSKISLVRGCNVLAGSDLHNGSFPTCASGTNELKEGNSRPIFPWSIDTVLAESSTVYPDPTGKVRQTIYAPANGYFDNFSWQKKNGVVEHIPETNSTQSLLAKFSSLGATSTPTVDAKQVRKADVIQNVYSDYKSLRDGGKLSADDRNRLEAYLTLINEAQQAVKLPSVACKAPGQESEGNVDAAHRNQIKIVVAALACDLTRVASHAISVGYDPMHEWAHSNGMDGHAGRQKQLASFVALLIKEMDAVKEADGTTLLDNSLVYYGNEFGELGNGDAHVPRSLQVLLAGGCQGTVQMGYAIDYRKSGNRPMNNLLVTLANAMGLSSAEYQREGQKGFGEYAASAINKYSGINRYTTEAERIKPLAFLYKGPTLG